MEIKAGSNAQFADSMAKAIESAFETEWENVKGKPLSESAKEERRILFVAIAQGVVKHLKINAEDGFHVYDVVEDEGKLELITTGELY
jgi:hypothetical protein